MKEYYIFLYNHQEWVEVIQDCYESWKGLKKILKNGRLWIIENE